MSVAKCSGWGCRIACIPRSCDCLSLSLVRHGALVKWLRCLRELQVVVRSRGRRRLRQLPFIRISLRSLSWISGALYRMSEVRIGGSGARKAANGKLVFKLKLLLKQSTCRHIGKAQLTSRLRGRKDTLEGAPPAASVMTSGGMTRSRSRITLSPGEHRSNSKVCDLWNYKK